jgi:GTP 3',8-cyclase
MNDVLHHDTPIPVFNAVSDRFGRVVDYLRISISDRCNARCLYCRPEGYGVGRQLSDNLTVDEILHVVRTSESLGIRKFRLTGGEPLVRPDVTEIIRGISSIRGVESLGLTTNGTRLVRLARALREAGLHYVNISLDTLDPRVYQRITGGNLSSVLDGIRAAKAVGFDQVKLNTVLLRSLNQNDVWPLIRFAAKHNVPLRFIEFMPVNRTPELAGDFLPVAEVMEQLGSSEQLIPQPDHHLGHGPAKYYRLSRTGALVGFIGAMTDQHFCEGCNRIRLTADGRIRPCLGNNLELDLRTALRHPATPFELAELLRRAISQKPQAHTFCGNSIHPPCRPMVAVGG